MATSVQIDTTELVKAAAKLAVGVPAAGIAAARVEAERVARDIAAHTPVRTGRLRATIGVVQLPNGAGVKYGGNLPYANYIDKRTNAVENATADADRVFPLAVNEAARKVANSL